MANMMLYYYARESGLSPTNYEGTDENVAHAALAAMPTLAELRINFSCATAAGEHRGMMREATAAGCDALMDDALAWLVENAGL